MKPTSSQPVSSEARRKLLRAGIASGPVIATLASPSVFATDCVAPSQTLSAAKSHTGNLGTCTSPGSCSYWKTRLGGSSCTSQEISWRDMKFHDIFIQQSSATGCRMYKTVGGVATKMSFYEVLCLTDTSAGTVLAQQFCAAYLNICDNKILFPVAGVKTQARCAQSVTDLWGEWVNKGSYTPYAGATPWDSSKINYYLTNFVPA